MGNCLVSPLRVENAHITQHASCECFFRTFDGFCCLKSSSCCGSYLGFGVGLGFSLFVPSGVLVLGVLVLVVSEKFCFFK